MNTRDVIITEARILIGGGRGREVRERWVREEGDGRRGEVVVNNIRLQGTHSTVSLSILIRCEDEEKSAMHQSR